MASRRELLDSLKPGMHLDKNFFLKIYGYDITRPGFADDVIRRLEILGCSKARDYYTCIVSEYNHKHDQEMKRVSEWYAKQDTDALEGIETRLDALEELQDTAEQLRECIGYERPARYAPPGSKGFNFLRIGGTVYKD